MGKAVKYICGVVMAATGFSSLVQSPMAQNSAITEDAPTLAAPKRTSPNRAPSQDEISIDADRRAAAAMSAPPAEPSPMPIIKGAGNPDGTSPKGAIGAWRPPK